MASGATYPQPGAIYRSPIPAQAPGEAHHHRAATGSAAAFRAAMDHAAFDNPEARLRYQVYRCENNRYEAYRCAPPLVPHLAREEQLLGGAHRYWR